MPSVYCTQCGHANPEVARFCSNCGTPLTRSVPPVMGDPGDSTSTVSLGAVDAADGETVSRRHAEFFRRGAQFSVRDVGSLNGTYVIRERIDEAGLSGGDEVQIGKFRLVFLTNPAPHHVADGRGEVRPPGGL